VMGRRRGRRGGRARSKGGKVSKKSKKGTRSGEWTSFERMRYTKMVTEVKNELRKAYYDGEEDMNLSVITQRMMDKHDLKWPFCGYRRAKDFFGGVDGVELFWVDYGYDDESEEKWYPVLFISCALPVSETEEVEAAELCDAPNMFELKATFTGKKWGFATLWERFPWSVTRVFKGGQAESLGVKAGWTLTHVNGECIDDDNAEHMRQKLVIGGYCQITFDTQQKITTADVGGTVYLRADAKDDDFANGVPLKILVVGHDNWCKVEGIDTTGTTNWHMVQTFKLTKESCRSADTDEGKVTDRKQTMKEGTRLKRLYEAHATISSKRQDMSPKEKMKPPTTPPKPSTPKEGLSEEKSCRTPEQQDKAPSSGKKKTSESRDKPTNLKPFFDDLAGAAKHVVIKRDTQSALPVEPSNPATQKKDDPITKSSIEDMIPLPPLPHNRNVENAIPQSSYLLGAKLTPNRSVKAILFAEDYSTEEALRMIVGLANNKGGGSVYFGMSRCGTIIGVRRDAESLKKELQLMRDRACMIKPSKPTYRVKVTQLRNIYREHVANLHVIKVKVKAAEKILRTPNDKVFCVREGNTSIAEVDILNRFATDPQFWQQIAALPR